MKNNVVLSRKNRRELRAAFRYCTKPSRQRRRGQALLLVVLVMLVAALISAGFLSIVSGNLNQTARTADRTKADEAARAGLRYVNDQLTYSPYGERWFSHNFVAGTVNPAAAPTIATGANPTVLDRTISGTVTPGLASSNPFYYSELDKVQDWAGKFIKYPDPNGKPASSTPRFLARVQRIPNELDANDPDRNDSKKFGQLKITVIGLSEDNPNVFSKLVSYKGGYDAAPFGRVMRTVSDWDFVNNKVPSGTVYENATGSASIALTDLEGEFPSALASATVPVAPFNVLIGTAGSVQGAVVKKSVIDTSLTPPRLVLTFADSTLGVTQGQHIEMAAALGSPRTSLTTAPTNADSGVDLNNDGATYTDINYTLSSDTNNAGGIRANGGLWLFGSVDVNALRLAANQDLTATPPKVRGSVKASGLIAKAPVSDATTYDVAADVRDALGNTTAAGTIGNSPAALNTSPLTVSSGTLTTAQIDEVVSDGAGSVSAVPTTFRKTKSFTPPALNDARNLARYRGLTRDSASTVTAQPGASAYGYGQGIYLNNSDDKEKIWDTATSAFREMKQSELVDMWLSPATNTAPPNYQRLGTAAALTATDASLEQQHLRGWVNPDEFHARGALVELDPDNKKVIITLESRGDGTTDNVGSATGKTWYAPDGTLLPGVYRRVLDWPSNGVIFAEGNVRVLGAAQTATSDPGRSLTIVSMGNIYVEGSVNAGTRKLLLLARKNVVANPTTLLGRADDQTRLAADVAAGATTLTVKDANAFKIGDAITIADGTATPYRGIVTAISLDNTNQPAATNDPATSDVLTVSPAVTTAVVATTPGQLVGTLNDFGVAPNTIPSLATTQDIIARRMYRPGATAATQGIVFEHGATRVDALTVATKNGGEPTDPDYLAPTDVALRNKGIEPATATTPDETNIVSTAKDFHVLVSGTDSKFPATPPSDPNTYLVNSTATSLGQEIQNSRTNPDKWSYEVTSVPAYDALPSHVLAAVGRRYDFSVVTAAATATAVSWPRNIGAEKSYTIPLATSVEVLMNGAISALTSEHTNGTALDTVNQFGFNRDYTLADDALTTDESFYNSTATNILTSYTIDSRRVAAVAGWNTMAVRDASGLAGLTLGAGGTWPTYRLNRLKAENVEINPLDGTLTSLKPGAEMAINAFVYAQEGSWFVIPGDRFDNRIKTVAVTGGTATYFDANNNNTPDLNATTGSEYMDLDGSGSLTAGDYPDFNRNGRKDIADVYAVERYLRYNYQIIFTGAIAENITPVINTTGTGTNLVDGAVANWVDRWMNYDSTRTTAVKWQPITYNFDPSYAAGLIDSNGGNPNTDTDPSNDDIGFQMPQSPDLAYTE